MPPRRHAANRNNQQEDQPIQQEDQPIQQEDQQIQQEDQQADQANQQADQANQTIQRLRDLSANTFSDASAFNRTLADFLIEIHEQLTELSRCVRELHPQNNVQKHELILNDFRDSIIRRNLEFDIN